jgi:hypothetical protein
MNVWELAILQSVNLLGGEGDLQEIYRTLPRFIQLTPVHLAPTKWGGRPAYEHQVRSHVTNLRQAGELAWKARGRYALTTIGRQRIGLAVAESTSHQKVSP